jgi:hypothetical protein
VGRCAEREGAKGIAGVDHEQFAALTRLVAARGSRRGALLAVLGTALFGRAGILDLELGEAGSEADAKGKGGRDGGKRHGRNRGNGRHRSRRRKGTDHRHGKKPKTSCADTCAGCCDGEFCITATSDEACGANGSPCVPCSAAQTCGGGNEPGVCGGGSCTPLTCEELGIACGPTGDGCGDVLDCGTCTELGETCGRCEPGVCGISEICTPLNCAAQGATCGPQSDGCGGTIDCGVCMSPETCGGGGVPSRCGGDGSGICTPRTCGQQGAFCGPIGDGCGGLITCGGACHTGRFCIRNTCRSAC